MSKPPRNRKDNNNLEDDFSELGLDGGSSVSWPRIMPADTPYTGADNQQWLYNEPEHYTVEAGPYDANSWQEYGDAQSSISSKYAASSTASSKRHSHRSSRQYSVADSVSTAPSRRSTRSNVNDHIARQPEARQLYELPCEFRTLGGCDSVFPGNQQDRWIAHIEEHLDNNYPAKAMCWFCSNWVYDAEQTAAGDRRANFHLRLDHIRDHIMDDGKRADEMKVDLYLISHLNNHRNVDRSVCDDWLSHSEVLQLPPREDWPDLDQVKVTVESKPGRECEAKKKERESKRGQESKKKGGKK